MSTKSPFKGGELCLYLHPPCYHLLCHHCVQQWQYQVLLYTLCCPHNEYIPWIVHLILGFTNGEHMSLNYATSYILDFVHNVTPRVMQLAYLHRQTSAIADQIYAPPDLSQYAYHPFKQWHLWFVNLHFRTMKIHRNTCQIMAPFRNHGPWGWVWTDKMNSSTKIGCTPSALTLI